ncbi:AcrR family transcriptional regulator [Rhizobium pisi]|uniref:AcrR family transcriptional regulator n=2 Tax=Rhizobium pisi TaxID=574561 RepID=A0A3R9AHL2_9HYPH|nr:TetR/AcrR family transcriptional regulator [Rhizobium pisi]MBB3134506.1 AcrR family transcriptional regulator [Rhizobium pisi]RSB79834.1 TetR/AcrR family transcriptional regulator [Rhizobium pisi]TCA60682.1 TetR/AcrR family transcriptional regulator [Rhizobium pisi]
MTKRVGKKTSRAERRARRPHEILEAAFEEFAAKGYAATRVEDVATRLGITKGTVYLYFPTKDVLFQEMFRHASTSSADRPTAIGGLRGSCAERIRALLLIAYENTANDRKTRELLRLSVAEGARLPEMVDCRHELFIAPTLAALTALVEEGVKSGELRRDTAAETPDVLASLIFQVAVWLLMFADRKPIDGKALMEAHIELVMSGLLQRSEQMV